MIPESEPLFVEESEATSGGGMKPMRRLNDQNRLCLASLARDI
jgi:hypothetical protein